MQVQELHYCMAKLAQEQQALDAGDTSPVHFDP